MNIPPPPVTELAMPLIVTVHFRDHSTFLYMEKVGQSFDVRSCSKNLCIHSCRIRPLLNRDL